MKMKKKMYTQTDRGKARENSNACQKIELFERNPIENKTLKIRDNVCFAFFTSRVRSFRKKIFHLPSKVWHGLKYARKKHFA